MREFLEAVKRLLAYLLLIGVAIGLWFVLTGGHTASDYPSGGGGGACSGIQDLQSRQMCDDNAYNQSLGN